MSPVLEVFDAAAIAARRAELVAQAGIPIERMRKLAANFKLDQERQAILRQLDELDFLASE